MTANGKDVYYFSHDANARSDPKIMALISEQGMTGYGRWWVLVEMLREQQNYVLEEKPYIWQAIAQQMQCDVEQCQHFVSSCVERYELLQSNGDEFWSPSLLRRMAHVDDIRAKRAESGRMAHASANAKQKPSKCKANEKQSDFFSFVSNVYKTYSERIRSGARQDALKWIQRRVKEHGEDAVLHAMDVYAEACRNKDVQYRYQANNFFGTKAYYLDYLNGAAKQPERTLRSLDGEQ